MDINPIGVFVIDPPWQRSKGGLRKIRPNQGRSLDYETLPVDEIFNILDIDIFTQASKCHCVFMWTIDKYLVETERKMLERGYKLHCRIIWDKTNGVAPAFTVRFTHEYLLWFYKPNLLPIVADMRGKLTTVWSEKAREHSRKPDIAYTNIKKMYPNSISMDVFSREKREGWLQYGNQVNHFSQVIGSPDSLPLSSNT